MCAIRRFQNRPRSTGIPYGKVFIRSARGTGHVGLMLVTMSVMQIGVVRMPMHQRLMPVPMAMRFAWRCARPVHVLMMVIMRMSMRVFEWTMCMLVHVLFGEVQPNADDHQHSSDDKLCS